MRQSKRTTQILTELVWSIDPDADRRLFFVGARISFWDYVRPILLKLLEIRGLDYEVDGRHVKVGRSVVVYLQKDRVDEVLPGYSPTPAVFYDHYLGEPHEH